MLKMKYLTEANLRGFEKYKVYNNYFHTNLYKSVCVICDNPYP